MSAQTGDNVSLIRHLLVLKPFLEDQQWTEICINEPRVVLTEGQKGWQTHAVEAVTPMWIKDLGKLTGNYVFSKFDQDTPSLAAVLPGGERIQMVMVPRVASGRMSVTIRKPSSLIKTLENFEQENFFQETRLEQSTGLNSEARTAIEAELWQEEKELLTLLRERKFVEFLRLAVIQKKNIVLSGATGAGKTTFANAIVACIPADERIITVEDVPEIRLPHIANKVSMLYQKATPGSAKAAFEDTLRMYPTRVLPAELRGDEAYFFIQNVLNSGHPGTVTTVHANSTKLAFLRLALMIQSSPEGAALNIETIQTVLHSLIDVVIQVAQKPSPSRARYIPEIYFDPAYARKQVG